MAKKKVLTMQWQEATVKRLNKAAKKTMIPKQVLVEEFVNEGLDKLEKNKYDTLS